MKLIVEQDNLPLEVVTILMWETTTKMMDDWIKIMDGDDNK